MCWGIEVGKRFAEVCGVTWTQPDWVTPAAFQRASRSLHGDHLVKFLQGHRGSGEKRWWHLWSPKRPQTHQGQAQGWSHMPMISLGSMLLPHLPARPFTEGDIVPYSIRIQRPSTFIWLRVHMDYKGHLSMSKAISIWKWHWSHLFLSSQRQGGGEVGWHRAAPGLEEAATGLWDSETRGWGTPTFLLISYLYHKPCRTNILYSWRYFCPVQLCGLAGALLWSRMTHANTAAYDLWRLEEKENSQLHYEGASFSESLFMEDQATIWSPLALSLSEMVNLPQRGWAGGCRLLSCSPLALFPAHRRTPLVQEENGGCSQSFCGLLALTGQASIRGVAWEWGHSPQRLTLQPKARGVGKGWKRTRFCWFVGWPLL